MATPFYGKVFTFTQPDGTQFSVRGWGDQHYAVFETLDGYTVVKDPVTGYYQFATVSTDGEELEPVGARADRFEGAALSLSPGARPERAAAHARGMEGFRLMGSNRRCEQRRQQARTRLRMAVSGTGPLTAPPQRQTVGTYVGLCLLIDFADEPASIARQEVENFCNQQGYTGFGNNGSVRDYFFDNSNGLFEYTNVVPAYYRAQQPKSFYTNPSVPHGTRARQLIREALLHLQNQGFDFSQLTVDSGGYVYAMNVYYAGFCPNNWSEGLWPHAWSLASPFDLGAGRLGFDYQFTDMGDELTLGTFCHENGHMVCDYPDLYDYGYESRGVGDFCLMCAGGSDSKNPTQISAYLKHLSGWATALTTIEHGAEIALSRNGSEYAIHRKNVNEYFILENRDQQGRDGSLPAAGLAIWHVDELGSNNNEQRTPSLHYELSLEQADGRFDMEAGVNNGDSGDLFHSAHQDRFADSTSPASKWWDGSASNLDVHQIGVHGEVITFRTNLHDEVDESTVFERSSSPAIAIPDNQPVGVTDAIDFDQEVTISSIRVSVDISHTYRGDLVVTLHAPSGTSVVLHPRHRGGSADDLEETFDVLGVPALASLNGQSAEGTWTIQVQDLADADTGVLDSWGLEIEGMPRAEVSVTESPGTRIPDDDPVGIERSLEITADGEVQGIEVSLDITHTYIGDLEVTLESPSSTRVPLHERSGGGDDDLVRIYTLATTPSLNAVIGEPMQGTWKLRVSDHEGADEGKLNRWQLEILR